MSKDKMETLMVGVGLMLFGILMIILAIVKHDQLWFTVVFTAIGTALTQRAYNYLKENFNKKRGH